MQLPGIQALGPSFFPQVAGNNPNFNPFGTQGPQVSGIPSPTSPSPLAGANLGGLPPASPFDMGSGVSNNFDTSTLSNVAPQILTPSNSPQQQFLSRQAGRPGGKFNCIG
jgi:hypothetical protein